MFRVIRCLIVFTMAAPAIAESDGMGRWLIDLGRDYPLTRQAGASDADATLTLLFMQAATRIEPDLAPAYYWQYDMLDALRRDAEARKAIAQYVKLQPDDAAAQLIWIDLALRYYQTAEERAEFCRSYLKRQDLPPTAAGELHARLAEFLWNRAETELARQQATQAIESDAYNLRARQLLREIEGKSNTPLSRVESYLWALRVNPADAQSAVELASLLLDAGLPAQADRWYDHAIQLAKRIPPGTAPADLLTARALALIEVGRLADAEPLLAEAEKVAPQDINVLLARVHLAARKGDLGAARVIADRINAEWNAKLTAGGMGNASIAAFAWALVHDLNDGVQAAGIAQGLLKDPNVQPIARRVLGAVQMRNQQWSEARATLEPAADQDIWARILLAQTLAKLGDHAGAAKQVASLTTQPADTEQRGEIRKLGGSDQGAAPTSQPGAASIEAALAQFPANLMDYPFHAEKYLAATWKISPPNPEPGEPWMCTLELKNIADFPIVIGRRAMLWPEILCEMIARGDQARTSGPSIRLLLHGTLQIKPGESLRITENMLVGRIRDGMIGTPQVTQKIELSSLANPMRLVDSEGHDVWWPAPGGQSIKLFSFERRSIVATPDFVRSLIAQSQAADATTRRLATAQLTMLLAEQQHIAGSRLFYSVPRIDPNVVQPAVLARASDSDWRLRAHFAEMARWIELDAASTKAMTALLGDPHWLVRGLAARALTDHYPQNETLRKTVLGQLSTSDPDDWVRQFTRALLQRTSAPPDTQPAPAHATPAPAAAPRAAENPAPARPLIALPEDTKPQTP